MAYAAVVTWKRSLIGERAIYNIHVVETEAAAASVWTTLDDGSTNVNQVNEVKSTGETVPQSLVLPEICESQSWKVTREAGTAATTAPMLGSTPGGGTFSSTSKDLLGLLSAAAYQYSHDVFPLAFRPNHSGPRYLSGRSVVDAGADNTIHTHIVLEQVP
jgi:hypothetical protein